VPYIIETTSPQKWGEDTIYAVSRHAVADLEDARHFAHRTVLYGWENFEDALYHGEWIDALSLTRLLTASGSLIGPLPDGTLIEVREVSWADLAEPLNWLGKGYVTEDDWPAVIKAYNSNQ